MDGKETKKVYMMRTKRTEFQGGERQQLSDVERKNLIRKEKAHWRAGSLEG